MLLFKIDDHEKGNKEILYKKRAPNLISRVFGLDTSTTKRVFNNLKEQLQEAKKADEDDTTNSPHNNTNIR